ncbi:hypothetical protein BaRGS_00006268, partial [Batillaria attramentaria]
MGRQDGARASSHTLLSFTHLLSHARLSLERGLQWRTEELVRSGRDAGVTNDVKRPPVRYLVAMDMYLLVPALLLLWWQGLSVGGQDTCDQCDCKLSCHPYDVRAAEARVKLSDRLPIDGVACSRWKMADDIVMQGRCLLTVNVTPLLGERRLGAEYSGDIKITGTQTGNSVTTRCRSASVHAWAALSPQTRSVPSTLECISETKSRIRTRPLDRLLSTVTVKTSPRGSEPRWRPNPCRSLGAGHFTGHRDPDSYRIVFVLTLPTFACFCSLPGCLVVSPVSLEVFWWSPLSNDDERAIYSIKTRCTSGSVEWNGAYGAIRLEVRPYLKHDYRVCFVVNSEHTVTQVSQETPHTRKANYRLQQEELWTLTMTPLVTTRGKSKEYCVVGRTSSQPVLLYVEVERTTQFTGIPVVTVQYVVEKLTDDVLMHPMEGECQRMRHFSVTVIAGATVVCVMNVVVSCDKVVFKVGHAYSWTRIQLKFIVEVGREKLIISKLLAALVSFNVADLVAPVQQYGHRRAISGPYLIETGRLCGARPHVEQVPKNAMGEEKVSKLGSPHLTTRVSSAPGGGVTPAECRACTDQEILDAYCTSDF